MWADRWSFLDLNRMEPVTQIGGVWSVVGALVGDTALVRNHWSKGSPCWHLDIRSSMGKSSTCYGLHFLNSELNLTLHRCLHSLLNRIIVKSCHSSSPLCQYTLEFNTASMHNVTPVQKCFPNLFDQLMQTGLLKRVDFWPLSSGK